MSKIHPTVSRLEGAAGSVRDQTTVCTVWKKSSMSFQGTDGFSVYDSKGVLAFRVDNYSRRNLYISGELVLMDGEGEALLTLRPQILSMHDRWDGFKANGTLTTGLDSHVFAMRRQSILQPGDEAEVFMGQSSIPSFIVEGCFRKRSCKIIDSTGKVVAQITRKKTNSRIELGDDVFSLIVHPGIDCQLMMAIVMVMDRISQKPYTPLICS